MSFLRQFLLLVLVGILVSYLSCRETQQDAPYLGLLPNEDTPFKLSIKTNAPMDSLVFNSWKEIPLAGKREHRRSRFEGVVDTVLTYNLIHPQVIKVALNGEFYKVFAMPGSEVELSVAGELGRIHSISADTLKTLHAYYLAIKQPLWSDSGGPWADQVAKWRTLFDERQGILDSFMEVVPGWFYSYEKKNLQLDFWEAVQSTYFYRRAMMDIDEPFPEDLHRFLDTFSIAHQETYLRSNYVNLVATKLIRDSLYAGSSLGAEADPIHRITMIVNGIDQLQGMPKQALAVKFYHMMQTSRFSFSDDLIQRCRTYLTPAFDSIVQNILSYSPSIVGKRANNFTLVTMQEDFITLKALAGKPIWLTFWFTGCKPCIKSFPAEKEMVKKYADTDMQFIRVCTNSEAESWAQMVMAHRLTSVNLFANENWSKILTKSYQLTSYPRYYLIDRQGNIVADKGLSPESSALDDHFAKVL